MISLAIGEERDPAIVERSAVYLEIACFDVQSVLLADGAGADRTEFCADRVSGGVTPSLQDITELLPFLQKPMNVMIRPRGGDFVYSEPEFEQMKHDIQTVRSASDLRRLGGFVFGILDANGEVDVPKNLELLTLAGQLPCTFHRAFDDAADPHKALEDVISCGFKAILTSGGTADAVSGVDLLKSLVAKASGRIIIMPGGGVRSSNIKLLMEKTKAPWYHSSAIVQNEIGEEEIRQLKRSLNHRASTSLSTVLSQPTTLR